MGAMVSQITSLTIVYSTVYSNADQRRHQSSASLAFVWGIRLGPVNSPHKWPVTRKMFPFDDVIMCLIRHAGKMTSPTKCFQPYWWLNTLRPRQNVRHFPDDILKCIFLNENDWISIKKSLKFVPKGQINNIRLAGAKPLSEPMMVSLLTHICVTRPQWVNVTET